MKPVVRFVITDTHMGLGHFGLNEVIRINKRKNPLFARVMKDGGMVLFLNAGRTAAKLFRENGEVIGYLRMPRKLTERSIDLIPQTFAGSLEYSQAVKSAFKKFLEEDAKEKRAERASLMA